MPVVEGETRFQPVYVGDVADAVMAAITRDDAAGRIYELGGPRVMTMREVLDFVLEHTHRRRLMVPLPRALVAFQAGIGEWLPTPPLTRDQLVLLARDNVVAADAAGLAGARHCAQGGGGGGAGLSGALPARAGRGKRRWAMIWSEFGPNIAMRGGCTWAAAGEFVGKLGH